jgi:membrane protein DedA with SNARE-associated domain
MNILTGTIGLALRMALVALAGWLAGTGIGFVDEEAGTLTIHIESLAHALGAIVSAGGWWVWRRLAKAKGGVT